MSEANELGHDLTGIIRTYIIFLSGSLLGSRKCFYPIHTRSNWTLFLVFEEFMKKHYFFDISFNFSKREFCCSCIIIEFSFGTDFGSTLHTMFSLVLTAQIRKKGFDGRSHLHFVEVKN